MAEEKPKKKRKRQARGKASRTNPQNVKARMKQAQALELRCEGKSFVEIAKELGYNSRQAAWDAVMRALDEQVTEPAERLRSIELLRLEKISEVIYLQATAGDGFAIQNYLNVMDRRHRLTGLAAPVKHELTGKDGEPLQAQPAVLNVIIENGESDRPAPAQEAGHGVPKPGH